MLAVLTGLLGWVRQGALPPIQGTDALWYICELECLAAAFTHQVMHGKEILEYIQQLPSCYGGIYRPSPSVRQSMTYHQLLNRHTHITGYW